MSPYSNSNCSSSKNSWVEHQNIAFDPSWSFWTNSNSSKIHRACQGSGIQNKQWVIHRDCQCIPKITRWRSHVDCGERNRLWRTNWQNGLFLWGINRFKSRKTWILMFGFTIPAVTPRVPVNITLASDFGIYRPNDATVVDAGVAATGLLNPPFTDVGTLARLNKLVPKLKPPLFYLNPFGWKKHGRNKGTVLSFHVITFFSFEGIKNHS